MNIALNMFNDTFVLAIITTDQIRLGPFFTAHFTNNIPFYFVHGIAEWFVVADIKAISNGSTIVRIDPTHNSLIVGGNSQLILGHFNNTIKCRQAGQLLHLFWPCENMFYSNWHLQNWRFGFWHCPTLRQ